MEIKPFRQRQIIKIILENARHSIATNPRKDSNTTRESWIRFGRLAIQHIEVFNAGSFNCSWYWLYVNRPEVDKREPRWDRCSLDEIMPGHPAYNLVRMEFIVRMRNYLLFEAEFL